MSKTRLLIALLVLAGAGVTFAAYRLHWFGPRAAAAIGGGECDNPPCVADHATAR
jgi:hypothetical protein